MPRKNNNYLTRNTAITHKLPIPVVQPEKPAAAIFNILMTTLSHQEGTANKIVDEYECYHEEGTDTLGVL